MKVLEVLELVIEIGRNVRKRKTKSQVINRWGYETEGNGQEVEEEWRHGAVPAAREFYSAEKAK